MKLFNLFILLPLILLMAAEGSYGNEGPPTKRRKIETGLVLSNTPAGESSLESLPQELVNNILSHLSIQDISNLGKTSSTLKRQANLLDEDITKSLTWNNIEIDRSKIISHGVLFNILKGKGRIHYHDEYIDIQIYEKNYVLKLKNITHENYEMHLKTLNSFYRLNLDDDNRCEKECYACFLNFIKKNFQMIGLEIESIPPYNEEKSIDIPLLFLNTVEEVAKINPQIKTFSLELDPANNSRRYLRRINNIISHLTQLEALTLHTYLHHDRLINTIVEKIKKSPHFHTLNLEKSSLDQSQINILLNYLEENQGPSDINLIGVELNAAKPYQRIFSIIQKNKGINSFGLVLSWGLSYSAVSKLLQVFRENQHIKHLKLQFEHTSIRVYSSLGLLIRKNKTLLSLDLSPTYLDEDDTIEEGFKIIARALKSNKTLKEINLGKIKISDEVKLLINKAGYEENNGLWTRKPPTKKLRVSRSQTSHRSK